MSFFESSNKPLQKSYGYLSQTCHLDGLGDQWAEKLQQPWSRPFEINCIITPSKTQGGCSPHMTDEEVAFFSKGARAGFRHIAQRHGMTPTQVWNLVRDGMLNLGLHTDDIEDLELFCFGWLNLTGAEMSRWSLRYPKRCPLLDALCSLDHTCEELNATQDWLLDSKGSYGRTMNDVLPALPEPDGIRPTPVFKSSVPVS
tara:strand:+ start:653 stop:1252 length:600 start_codon:yes stop_codon:yes gene_type:complete